MVVSGGSSRESGNTVERLDLTKDVWVELPKMVKERNRHAMCSAKDTIFVFCGIVPGVPQPLSCNSIERLDTRDLSAGWQIVEIAFFLSPRRGLGIAPLNEREIVILGGLDETGRPLKDIYVFNVEEMSLSQVNSSASAFDEGS